MSVRITQNGTSVPPSQVWSGLTTECQARVIQFLARLASHLVTEESIPTTRRLSPMMMQSFAPKIRPDHLDRLALVYVRQSTMIQVRENIASTARQYDLAGRARDLGWPPERIQVIDQDQGHSGASAAGRDGFQHLVAQVGLGRTGAVLSLEASRLARSCSDWYRLIEICALTNTLVIDEDGVYDPTQYSDRLLLGFLGTMSEAELHLLRSRLLGGKLKKASDGQLRFRPPTGLVYDLEGRIVFDPDEHVQQAIRLILDLFEQSVSALAVVQHFADHHLQCPTRLWGRGRERSSDLETAEPWPCPGYPAQPRVRGRLCLWTHQDSPCCACPVRSRGSRAEHARSGPRTGRSSSPGIIPVTSPGTSSSGTNGGLMTTGRRPMRIAAEPRVKASPCSRGSSVVDDAGGG